MKETLRSLHSALQRGPVILSLHDLDALARIGKGVPELARLYPDLTIEQVYKKLFPDEGKKGSKQDGKPEKEEQQSAASSDRDDGAKDETDEAGDSGDADNGGQHDHASGEDGESPEQPGGSAGEQEPGNEWDGQPDVGTGSAAGESGSSSDNTGNDAADNETDRETGDDDGDGEWDDRPGANGRDAPRPAAIAELDLGRLSTGESIPGYMPPIDRKAAGGDGRIVGTASASEASTIKTMRVALSRMSGGFNTKTTPLWDNGKLVRRLAANQDYMPAKREDDGNPVILFLCDMSGSCSRISSAATRVANSASALGVRGSDVWVLQHSDLSIDMTSAIHNGKPAFNKLSKLAKDIGKKNPTLLPDELALAAIKPNLIINITDMDNIAMAMNSIAFNRYKTLMIMNCPQDYAGAKEIARYAGEAIRPEDMPIRGVFYTTRYLVEKRVVVGMSSYYRYGVRFYGYVSPSRSGGKRPMQSRLTRALTFANACMLWSFYNNDLRDICDTINNYAATERLQRLIIR